MPAIVQPRVRDKRRVRGKEVVLAIDLLQREWAGGRCRWASTGESRQVLTVLLENITPRTASAEVNAAVDPLMITVAPVGAEVMREHNPHVPYTPAEIAEECYRAWNEGASIAHLHARMPDGRPTQDPGVYREIIELVSARTDLIIQVSTGGAVGMSREQRVAPVSLKPEMATLTCGTVNFGDGIFVNSQEDMEFFASAIKAHGVKPELEIFDAGMVENARRLEKKKLVEFPAHFDFVMGVPGGISGDPRNLVHLISLIPEGSTWSVAGIGRYEIPLGTIAVVTGGHVRVGFEDNIYLSRGVLAKSNAELVAKIARIAGEVGRPVASPAEARRILGLPQRAA